MSYTIKQVAEKLDLTAYTLRYYEKEGLLPGVERNEQGNRVFSERDIDWLTLIRCLRNTGMPVHEIKRYVELSRQGDQTVDIRRQIIVDHKVAVEEKIVQMNNCLVRINKKLDYYDEFVRGKKSASPCDFGSLSCVDQRH